jgi:hypothetical protein
MQHNMLRFTGLVLAALLMASCSQWFAPKPAPKPKVHHAKTHYDTDAFVEHLARARLAADDSEASAEDYDVLESYMAQKPQKLRRQTVLIITYQDEDGERSEVAAPVPVKPYNVRFPGVLEVMQKLGPSRTLHDLRIAATSVVPTDAFRTAADADARRIALEQQHQWLLTNAQALPPLEDAQVQLQLVGFFIEYRFRDAAYLAVDNVKRLLAAATSQKPVNKEALRILSRKLETLEELLHKTMPFTL